MFCNILSIKSLQDTVNSNEHQNDEWRDTNDPSRPSGYKCLSMRKLLLGGQLLVDQKLSMPTTGV